MVFGPDLSRIGCSTGKIFDNFKNVLAFFPRCVRRQDLFLRTEEAGTVLSAACTAPKRLPLRTSAIRRCLLFFGVEIELAIKTSVALHAYLTATTVESLHIT